MEGGGRKVSSFCLILISDELAVVMKSPSGDTHHNKEVEAHEKSLSQLCKQNKGEEDELKKGEAEDIDGEHNKEDPGEEKEDEEENGEQVKGETSEEFYEVEAIRKKRNHNGQLQYLIKWSNYPETDNTWEPYDNIKYCTDMLEAFEHSLQKRKSKSAMSPAGGEIRDSKKSSGRALTIERDVHVRRNPERNVNSVYKKEKYKLKNENGKEKFTQDEAMTNEIPMPSPKGVEEMNKEGDTNFVMQDYVRKWREKEDAKAGVGATTMAIFLPNCEANIAAHGEVPPVGPMGYYYSEFEPQSKKEGNRLTGARRRKAGRVRRFVHPDELAKKVMNVELADSTEAITASAVATDTTIGSNSKTAPEELHITEILKPVQVQLFATSTPGTSNISHACITFKALSSIGILLII
ncbi:Chromo domain protein LHP1 [Carex littledalei]|uniref:Chromo domain protein LHP1 n=1 Tax=Carex littledalei TaxID=544730 RepID=A0A833R5K3_9POAL|nr:Chromo domain protein LHP1 [Carex littledalei]